MKIKTITCHHVYNHGAYLQAYALVTHLKSMGHDAEIINYRPDYLRGHFKLTACNPQYSRIGLGWLYILTKLPLRLLALKRKKAFDKFYKQFIPVTTTEYKHLNELKINPPIADCYIAGSDQIWNTSFRNGTDAAFYLDFGSRNTLRISYAASFATEKLEPHAVNFVKTALHNFDHISVREESGLNILQEHGFNGSIVVDPVFLLPPSHWYNSASTQVPSDDYVLIYDFEKCDTVKQIAQKIAQKLGLKIYSVSPYRLKYADKNFINYGPDSFIGLIKNARYVISNSFHGTVFALIFNKDFIITKRSDGLNIRMSDLCNRYNLSSRIVDTTTPISDLIKPIDYAQIQPLIEADINSSKSYLEKCLGTIQNDQNCEK